MANGYPYPIDKKIREAFERKRLEAGRKLGVKLSQPNFTAYISSSLVPAINKINIDFKQTVKIPKINRKLKNKRRVKC